MISYDAFNSEIFRIKMGNIIYADSEFVSEDVFEEMFKLASLEGYNHLSIKIPTSDVPSANCFLKHGFLLVDTLVRYKLDLGLHSPADFNSPVVISKFTNTDVPYITQIAHDSFNEDRFHSDPSLDNELCDYYYEKWAANSCAGFADDVLVAKLNDTVVGFITLKRYESDGYGQIVLEAVSEQYRGQGVYKKILQGALQYFYSFPSLKEVIVGTQINVLPVQKTWMKNGFTILDSYYVLHKTL